MHPLIPCVLFGTVLRGFTLAAESAPPHPGDTATLSLESGVLWGIGRATPLAYRLVPTQLSWRSKEFLGHGFSDGSRIMIRHRLTLIGTVILQGPESHYLGFAGSPSVEWWDRSGTWSFFTGSGGGFGVIDSGGIVGGQGQDLTLNWFMRGGVEHVSARNLRFHLGFMYQHLSNGGMSKPNPGIDALGFTFGYSWTY